MTIRKETINFFKLCDLVSIQRSEILRQVISFHSYSHMKDATEKERSTLHVLRSIFV